MSVTKSFTAVGDGPELLVRHGQRFTYAVSGTFVGTVKLQQFARGGWRLLATHTAAGGAELTLDNPTKATTRVRIKCSAFTSGTIVTSIAASAADVGTTIGVTPAGVGVFQMTDAGPVVAPGLQLAATSPLLTTPLGAVCAIEAIFVEAGAGVYTASIPVPAGATILDILVNAVALWTAATSALLDVGDADPDGYYTAVDLKATDLLAGESLSFALAGGKAGAYIANSQVSPRYAAAARTVTGIVTSVGAGTAGRTRLTVVYHLPVAADVLTAAFVAA